MTPTQEKDNPRPFARRLDPHLGFALVSAFLWHGGLLVSGSHRRTYDAYIHMFFGDHYARNWFSTWETRWYTGFTTTSYPPGSHQLIALLSPVFGLEGSFVIVQLLSVLALIVGVWRFSQIWVSREAAGWAALLAVVSSSLAEVVHVFGQLPTTLSLAILLNTLPSIHRWVLSTDCRQFLLAMIGLAATTAAHHVTTLFGAVFFVGPVMVTGLLDAVLTPRTDETGPAPGLNAETWRVFTALHARRLLGPVVRCSVIGVTAIVVLVITVLPYWIWSSSDPIVQVPIPHATRDNFLTNTAAGIVFFLVPWGVLSMLLPFALIKGIFSRAVPLAASTVLLLVLGTGSTTPIPRLLLRGAFDILTLDRFTVWATITILPLAGAIVHSLVSGLLGQILRHQLGEGPHRATVGMGAAAFVLFAVLSANFSHFRPLQPDRVDPGPIAEFMSKDQHDRWRYLMLGFGDQMAFVSASMTATTVDGNYHSARRLPELTSRSVERLEGAKFRGASGLGSLQQFVATPERYNLKFVFSNDVFYDPLLWASGWHRVDRLENGIQIWEREDIAPLPEVLPTREAPFWQRMMWGLLPMTALAVALLGAVWSMAGLPMGRLAALERRLARSASNTWPARMLNWVDRRLAAGADQSPLYIEPSPRWFESRRAEVTRRIERLAGAGGTSSPGRRRLQRLRSDGWVHVSAGLVALNVIVGAAWLMQTQPPDPVEAVEGYYDDLDFRRFGDAYEALNPDSRPSFDFYRLALSVEDGLVASYGELDAIQGELVSRLRNRAEVEVELTYLTAVNQHTVIRTHEVRKVGDTWYLTPDPIDNSTTPDQFARATEVNYLSQGRRQLSVKQTSFGDTLDRPRLQTVTASAVALEGRLAVVGEITNLDVDPADLTVTTVFRDHAGETLVEHNASIVTIHKVLPRETVPFRVDLESVDAVGNRLAPNDFHREIFAAPEINIDDIATVELSIKAVVTGRDLDRSVQAQDLMVKVTPDGLVLTGDLRNAGVHTATLPHVLVTLLGEDGSVAWVDHLWFDRAIRPQRSQPFEIALTNADTLRALDSFNIEIFGDDLKTSDGGPYVSGGIIDLPPESGFAQARVSVHSFFRAVS